MFVNPELFVGPLIGFSLPGFFLPPTEISCYPMNSVFGLESRSLCYLSNIASVSPIPFDVPRALLENPVELPVWSSSGSSFLLGSSRLILDSLTSPWVALSLFRDCYRASIAFLRGAFWSQGFNPSSLARSAFVAFVVFLVPDGGLFLASGLVLLWTIGVVGASLTTRRAPLPLLYRMLNFYRALSTATFLFWLCGTDMSGADWNLVSPPSVDSWVTIFLCMVN